MIEFILPAAITFVVFGIFAVIMSLGKKHQKDSDRGDAKYHTLNR